jgi:hypothetical protein
MQPQQMGMVQRPQQMMGMVQPQQMGMMHQPQQAFGNFGAQMQQGGSGTGVPRQFGQLGRGSSQQPLPQQVGGSIAGLVIPLLQAKDSDVTMSKRVDESWSDLERRKASLRGPKPPRRFVTPPPS